MSNNKNRSNSVQKNENLNPIKIDESLISEDNDLVIDESQTTITETLGDEVKTDDITPVEGIKLEKADKVENILKDKGIVKGLNPPVTKVETKSVTPAPWKDVAVASADATLKVGMTVKLKDNVTETVTGTMIPVSARKRIYKVDKVLPRRVVISAGGSVIAVKSSDLTNA